MFGGYAATGAQALLWSFDLVKAFSPDTGNRMGASVTVVVVVVDVVIVWVFSTSIPRNCPQ
eukprot:scaffold10461_cov115-Cylindrotheca_fusiformis.AAC.2